MSVKYYCGPPGSGKSYHVVKEVIIPNLKDGRKILTNLPVKLDVMASLIPELKYVRNMDLIKMISDDEIRDIHKIVAHETYTGYLIIIDEAHNYWPSGDAIRNKDFKKWYTEHRHFFQDIVIVTQAYENVHKFISSLMDARFQYSKNDDLGFSNSYNEDYYAGRSKKKPVRSMHNYDSFYFQFYHSHSQNLSGQGHAEKRVGKKINILKKHLVTLGISASIAGFLIIRLLSDYSDRANPEGQSSTENLIEGRSGAVQVISPTKSAQLASNRSASNESKESLDEVSNGFDWCKNMMRISVGIGSSNSLRSETKFKSQSGADLELTGPHLVSGIIGVGSRNIYIFKNRDGRMVTGVLTSKVYSVGEKVCL
jgi:zona occludens toxin